MNEQTFMKLMQLLPKSALSSAVGLATRLPAPAPVHRMAMKAFAKAYNVDMEEAEHPLRAATPPSRSSSPAG